MSAIPIETYRGWAVQAHFETGVQGAFFATQGSITSPDFTVLHDLELWIDAYISGTTPPHEPPPPPTDNPRWILSDGNWLSVHWEDAFYHENHTAFSPLTEKKGTIENVLLVGFLIKCSKTPEGMKTLEKIAVKYLDSCASIIESVQKASAQNWLTALNNQHLAAAICHRIGLIDDGGYEKVVDHYRSVFDKMFLNGVAQATLGAVSTLVQGSTYSAGGKEGMSSEGIGSLLALLRKQ
jgi:hypothetical protein